MSFSRLLTTRRRWYLTFTPYNSLLYHQVAKCKRKRRLNGSAGKWHDQLKLLHFDWSFERSVLMTLRRISGVVLLERFVPSKNASRRIHYFFAAKGLDYLPSYITSIMLTHYYISLKSWDFFSAWRVTLRLYLLVFCLN